jgi:glycerol-3-phosphate dehydrogenase subunit B
VWKPLKDALAAQVIEVPGLPPSIPGQRLHKALGLFLRKLGAEFRHNLEVVDFTAENDSIRTLVAKDSSNTTHQIEAGSVILASGSYIGGGLVAKKDSLLEPVFKLPVMNPQPRSETHLLSVEGQSFLSAGIEVDDQLRPLNRFVNLHAVGSILAHSNYASEKSGLGVAIASGYKAGNLA